MDGTVSHWKYIKGNVIVYRDVYREGLWDCGKDGALFPSCQPVGRFVQIMSRLDRNEQELVPVRFPLNTEPLWRLAGT
jgi:hypothetical protein